MIKHIFIGRTQVTNETGQMILKGNANSFPAQGLCKLECCGKFQLFRYKLEEAEQNEILLTQQTAKAIGIYFGDQIQLQYFVKDSSHYDIDVLYLKLIDYDHSSIQLQKCIQIFKQQYSESIQPLNIDFDYRFSYQKATLNVNATQMLKKDHQRIGLYNINFGFVTNDTQVLLDIPQQMGITIAEDKRPSPKIAAQRILGKEAPSFQDLGIGGLDKVFRQIIELVLLPRLLSIEHMELLQIEPSRGFILEGPPGTGKTLIASKLGQLLKAHVKIVRGPEMVTKYVGQGAQLVRELFSEAYHDWDSYGNDSPLHVILIDEIDSLCPQRGSNSSVDGGATDQIVGSFLTMIQGIQTVNNFVIIGTTNRANSIDKALLRPGRLSHTFHVGYPDDLSRQQIWQIHLSKQIQANIVDTQVIPELVEASKGFSGAMIKACVNTAIFHQLQTLRIQDGNSVAAIVEDAIFLTEKMDEGQFRLTKECLMKAIQEQKK